MSFGTIVAVVFIAVCGAAGVYVGTKPTVINGKAMAASMLENAAEKGARGLKVTCQDDLVDNSGAQWECTISSDSGASTTMKFTMLRSGKVETTTLSETGPTGERKRGWD